jgi:hypothetical protein
LVGSGQKVFTKMSTKAGHQEIFAEFVEGENSLQLNGTPSSPFRMVFQALRIFWNGQRQIYRPF